MSHAFAISSAAMGDSSNDHRDKTPGAGGPSVAGDSPSAPDFERDLGVIEAISIVTRSCPNGGVIRSAERALEAIKAGGPDVLKQQAYFVLTAIKGWRGDRARQVHRSLSRYLELDSTPRK
jgi:hypothetical protein